MRIRTFPTPRAAALALAAEVARALGANPRLVLGLPAGRTPVPLYRELAALSRAGRVDFSRATTFTLDEFLGVAPSDASSYCAFMRRHLFDAVDPPPGRTHALDGTAADPEAECARYERAIRRAGGIDLQILGLGANGHVGFNEPAGALVARTHVARLTPATRRANAALFGGRAARVPRRALSMGMATILQARRIVLIAAGRGKARAVARTAGGPITPGLPASFLQLHTNADLWLDRDAASLLDVQ